MKSPASDRLIDVAWTAVFAVLLLVCGPGLMFLSAAYLTPWVLDVANCAPRDSMGRAIAFSILFGSLTIGFAVALAFLGIVTRRFIPLQTHVRWVRQFHAGANKLPYLQRRFGMLVLKLMSPSAARELRQPEEKPNGEN